MDIATKIFSEWEDSPAEITQDTTQTNKEILNVKRGDERRGVVAFLQRGPPLMSSPPGSTCYSPLKKWVFPFPGIPAFYCFKNIKDLKQNNKMLTIC